MGFEHFCLASAGKQGLATPWRQGCPGDPADAARQGYSTALTSPALVRTPQPHNIITHYWHHPGSAPQNAPCEVRHVLYYLLLTRNGFCLFCTQKQQRGISVVPQPDLSGDSSSHPRVLPSPACLHSHGVLSPPQPLQPSLQ